MQSQTQIDSWMGPQQSLHAQPTVRKRSVKKIEKADQNLSDLIGSLDSDKKSKLRPKRNQSYLEPAEVYEEQTADFVDNRSLPMQQYASRTDVLAMYYDEFVKKPTEDTKVQNLVKELNIMLKDALAHSSDDKLDKLCQSFQIILQSQFDDWYSDRSRSRPKVWEMLTPKMIIDAVVWKLEYTTVDEPRIGEYARLVSNKIQRRDFDFDLNCVENSFHLAETRQVQLFVKYLLTSYIQTEHDIISLKLAPVVLGMKLG